MVGFNIMGTQKNVPKNEEENKKPLFHLEIWFPPLHKGGGGLAEETMASLYFTFNKQSNDERK